MMCALGGIRLLHSQVFFDSSQAHYNEKSFESITRAKKFARSRCALGGIRTPNNCFEGRYDIHFTTSALVHYTQKRLFMKVFNIYYCNLLKK